PPAQPCAGPRLVERVQAGESVGLSFYAPILNLQPPGALCADLKPGLDAVLLKALRLRVDETGLLDAAPGYETFKDMAAALEPLA
ncbi:MAG: hypothetical protein KIS92_25610, partial [Planctomycetota bacterium]|nr:hypothetical protein [Planctomycetota bacterium]